MQDGKNNLLPTKKDVDSAPKGTLLLVTYAVILIVALLNLNATLSFIGWLTAMFTPFLVGLFIAFILNIIIMRLENHVFKFLNKPKYKLWRKIKRPVCLLAAIILVSLIISALLFFIVPQLGKSLDLLAKNIPAYVGYMQEKAYRFFDGLKLSEHGLGNLELDWNAMIARAGDWAAGISPKVFTFASGLTSGLFNFIMGVVFAVYLLLSKESLLYSLKKALYAFLPRRFVVRVYEVGALSNKIFSSFVVGQLTEAVILGTMYFIGTSIFGMPYASLISTLMAVCSLIPLFGPLLGALPSVLILVMGSPKDAIIFAIMAIVFQQIEGNFIYPKIVGNSVGLPGMWVLLALLAGGYLFGAVGMILSVPICSVLYSIFRTMVDKRLEERKINL